MVNNSNTHSDLILNEKGVVVGFIDGVPDTCEHDWTGEGIHYVGKEGDVDFYKEWTDTTLLAKGFDLTTDEGHKKFTEKGYFLKGGAVTCKKCKKPYSPDLFMF